MGMPRDWLPNDGLVNTISARYPGGAPHADFAPGQTLPMSDAAFRAALDPTAIVRARATAGGPQPAEMQRMLARAQKQLDTQTRWEQTERAHIDESLQKLDQDFVKLQGSK